MKKVVALLVLGTLSLSMGSLTWAENDRTQAETEVLKALYNGGYYTISESDLTDEEKDQNAISAFEAEWNLEEDGEVDQIVIDKMLSIGMLDQADLEISEYTFSKTYYNSGIRHNDVAVLQRALLVSGWLTDDAQVNGYFDAATLDAVKAFQQFNDLEVDGVVGPATIQLMVDQGLTVLVNEIPVSRGTSRAEYGEYLNWWSEVKGKIVDRGTELRIRDIYTGLEYNVMMTYGGNHADVEAMTVEDSEIIKQTYGGDFGWGRRPVLVFVDGRVIAASMSAMPHAGRDDQPAEALIYNRSLGYGYGYNLDKIKNNGMDGVCDLHFAGSTRHLDGRQDSQHQAAIRIAAGK